MARLQLFLQFFFSTAFLWLGPHRSLNRGQATTDAAKPSKHVTIVFASVWRDRSNTRVTDRGFDSWFIEFSVRQGFTYPTKTTVTSVLISN